MRFARSLAHSARCVTAHSGPPLQTYKLVGSDRSGDKNRRNEDDLKFRSRTISRNNITLRDEHERVRVRSICHCPSSTYGRVGSEDNLGISHVKTSYGIADRVAVVIDFVETASAISRCMDGRGSGIVITSADPCGGMLPLSNTRKPSD